MIRWFRQEHASSCVAACVRMVFAVLECERTEAEIRAFLGNPRFGLTLRNAEAKLSQAGWMVERHEDWGLDDLRDALRNGHFPIVGIERRFFGHPSAAHAVVVVAVRSHEIEFLDPLIEKPQLTSVDTFFSAWHFAGQEALMIYGFPSE